jgi:hypothetical protein
MSDELDPGEPFDLPESELDFVAEPESGAMAEAEGWALML